MNTATTKQQQFALQQQAGWVGSYQSLQISKE
jgi:hypothetical protein